ncbi:MAG: VIT1/CCC1 transporter family protein [Planctomycetota bacterium]
MSHEDRVSHRRRPDTRRPTSWFQRYTPELIYGGNDGIVTTFAIIAGVAGARLAPSVILILGFASLFADGASMAASDYLAERSRPDGKPLRIEAARNAAATFLGFMVLGVMPLLAYVVGLPPAWRLPVAAGLTLCCLFTVGSVRALGIDHIGWLRGGLEMLIVGTVAAALAFGVGRALGSLGPPAG